MSKSKGSKAEQRFQPDLSKIDVRNPIPMVSGPNELAPRDLSPEQQAKLEEYREHWKGVVLRTGNNQAETDGALAAMRAIYEISGIAPGEVEFLACDSPSDVVAAFEHKAAELLDGVDPFSGKPIAGMTEAERETLRVQILDNWWTFGQSDAYWTMPFRFCVEALGMSASQEDIDVIHRAEALALGCWVVYAWGALCCIVKHPERIAMDSQERFHAVDGPSVRWPDGSGLYYLCNIPIDWRLGQAMADGTLTAAQIRDVDNAEVRRVLTEVFNAGDPGRYARELGATVVDSDVDQYGRNRRLLRMEQNGDEAYQVVEVTNSTPEPDGHYKLYTIRVSPNLTTCKAAVASTFRMVVESPLGYNPIAES